MTRIAQAIRNYVNGSIDAASMSPKEQLHDRRKNLPGNVALPPAFSNSLSNTSDTGGLR
jgi:hypothetical protein